MQVVTTIDILEELLHEGDLEPILLVSVDVFDQAIVPFKTEQPIAIHRPKVKDGF